MRWWMWGWGAKGKRARTWMRDERWSCEVGHSYWRSRQKINEHICKRAFTHTHAHFHKHTIRQTVRSCVPTASFPCKAPKIKPAQPAGSTEVLHFAPLLRTPGLEERHKALPKYHKGASLVLPHLSCPLGRQPFTWIFCYTSHTRNKVLAGIWTRLVTQATHTPPLTNLTPLSGEPPVDKVNIQRFGIK